MFYKKADLKEKLRVMEFQLNNEDSDEADSSDSDSGSMSQSSMIKTRSNIKDMASCNYFSAVNTTGKRYLDRRKNDYSLLQKYQSFSQHNSNNMAMFDVQKRILIVDDEPYNILGLTTQLAQMGFNNIQQIIDQAFNGQSALDMVKAAHVSMETPRK